LNGIDHGIDNDIFYRVYIGTFNGILNEIGSCFQTGFFIGQSVYGIVDGIYNEICYIVMGCYGIFNLPFGNQTFINDIYKCFFKLV
jgi:hypothetical protein